jgi:hypothetical protein
MRRLFSLPWILKAREATRVSSKYFGCLAVPSRFQVDARALIHGISDSNNNCLAIRCIVSDGAWHDASLRQSAARHHKHQLLRLILMLLLLLLQLLFKVRHEQA